METHVTLEKKFLAVTSKKEADELLESCELETLMISTHIPDGIYSNVSKTCLPFLGYTPKELIGSSPYDYFHPEDFQRILKSHAKVTIRPIVDTVEYRIKLKDGSFKSVKSISRQIVELSGFQFLFVFTVDKPK